MKLRSFDSQLQFVTLCLLSRSNCVVIQNKCATKQCQIHDFSSGLERDEYFWRNHPSLLIQQLLMTPFKRKTFAVFGLKERDKRKPSAQKNFAVRGREFPHPGEKRKRFRGLSLRAPPTIRAMRRHLPEHAENKSRRKLTSGLEHRDRQCVGRGQLDSKNRARSPICHKRQQKVHGRPGPLSALL